MIHKGKTDKLDLIKIKSFCLAKDPHQRMKRQVTDWEKTFANDISDKDLVSRIHEELSKFTNKKQTIHVENGQSTWAQTFH